MSAVKRFGNITDKEIDEKRSKINSANTDKANKRAANTLRAYLSEIKEERDFENFDQERICEILSRFYLDARKPDGEHYKVSSLDNFRYSLNRYLQNPPFNKRFDIIKDASFREANSNFRAAIAELKRLGKGAVTHHRCISDEDRTKMYSSLFMSTETPVGLFNKVQFDIRLYFFRRGIENMHTMTKNTFEIVTNANSGLRYVKKKKDELTKNHREFDREMTTGIMPESPNNPFCPVNSFTKYLSKLNSECERLWQRPRDSYFTEDPVWFVKSPVGEKTLAAFMPKISQLCKLSFQYTNHCIRATGATILSQNRYGAAQIMAVTGHKAVSSLAVYQRVSDSEKEDMGRTITACLTKDTDHPAAVPTAVNLSRAIQPKSSLATASSASSDDRFESHIGTDFDMSQLFEDFPMPPVISKTSISNSVNSNPMPFFHGCQINSLNIVINNK